MKESQKQYLLDLARSSIKFRFQNLETKLDDDLDETFYQKRGAFVTLKIDGQLRGCIGYIQAIKPLAETIVEMAQAAAFDDPRFFPLAEDEFAQLEIEISILSQLTPFTDHNDLVIGRDGIVIRGDYCSGLLLPQVAVEWGWDELEFLEKTCVKAGLDKCAWKLQENKLFRFSAEIFAEKK